MLSDLNETLKDELGLTPESTVGPGDRPGEWHAMAAHFGARGFVRILLREHDGLHAWVELASSSFDRADLDVLQGSLSAAIGGELKFEQHADAWHASYDIPNERDAQILLFAQLLKIADVLSKVEDGQTPSAAIQEVVGAEPQSEDSAPAPFEAIGDDEPDAPQAPTKSAFEQIGDGSSSAETRFEITRDGDAIVAQFWTEGLDEASTADGLFAALRRNIRGRFDAQIERLDSPNSVKMRLTPDELMGKAPSLNTLEQQVGEYLENVVSIATTTGIDPLVYLGVRDSLKIKPRRPVEEEPDRDEAPPSVLVEDDDDDGEAVFFSSEPAEDDNRLEAGRYDDPRLKMVDSDAGLVDVVLRHPGYSDRRVGQVLTILLSIEYHEALTLMNAAPCVIAVAVAASRAASIKSVVEGAGGKILLTDPGHFSPL